MQRPVMRGARRSNVGRSLLAADSKDERIAELESELAAVRASSWNDRQLEEILWLIDWRPKGLPH